MDYEQLLDSLTPALYLRLKQAVETGYWPDGRAVTAEQREHCLQAVITWGERNLPPEERVGYIDRGRKGTDSETGPRPLRWAEGEGPA
jgi:uncharacterized protein